MFPKGWENFPNFDLVIADIANNIKLTPLEELELKKFLTHINMWKV